MRLLVLAKSLHEGGAQLLQADVVAGLAGRGCVVDALYAQPGGLLATYERMARSVQRVPAFHVVPARPATLLGVLRTIRRGRRAGSDAVYIGSYHDSFVAHAIARPRRVPVICFLCHPRPTHPGLQLRVGMAHVTTFVAGSHHTRDEFVAFGVEPSRIVVVPTGVDVGRFTPATDAVRAAARAELGLRPDAPVVLFAGRLDREKGVDVLLEAAPAAQLVIVGAPYHPDAAYAADLRRLSERVGAVVLPWHHDMARVYAAADVVVVPSRWEDPSPLVPLEAMACGVPVIAAAVGGVPEVFAGGFEDQLVPKDDPGALAGAIARVLDWRQREPDLGRRSRAHVEAGYTIDQTVEGVAAALEAAVR